MNSPLSTSPVAKSVQDDSDAELAELKANLINMVSVAIDSLTREGLIGSANGKATCLELIPTGLSSSSLASHVPLPLQITSAPAPVAPAPNPEPLVAATTPILSPPTPTTSEGDGDALASYITSASPFGPDLDDRLKAVRRQVQGITVGSGLAFPQLSNIGLSKDEKTAIAWMADSFKLFCMILQLSTHLALRHLDAAEDIKDITTAALVGMRTQLRARDKQWMTKALPSEALPTFRAMEGSTLMAQDRKRFFGALKFAMLKQQAARPQLKSGGGKWNSGSQLSPFVKGKKPYNSYYYYNNNKTSPSGHGAGPQPHPRLVPPETRLAPLTGGEHPPLPGASPSVPFMGSLRPRWTRWQQEGALPTLLRWIRLGVKLLIWQLPALCSAQNHHLTECQAEFVDGEIHRLLEEKALQELLPHKQAVLSPIGVVPKKNSKARLIIDMRLLNLYVRPPKFKYQSLRYLATLLRPGDFLFTIDFKDGFHHVEVHPDHQHLLGFCWRNR